jgi:hypothetical protein
MPRLLPVAALVVEPVMVQLVPAQNDVLRGGVRRSRRAESGRRLVLVASSEARVTWYSGPS